MRLAIVGPVSPFRGGIAQHTTSLANALSQSTETKIFSFSRLYPSILYPGASQTDPDGRKVECDVEYSLDSISPTSWRRVAKRICASEPDAVIVPWWTFFLAPCIRSLGKHLADSRIPIIFICHNVVDHESARWKTWLSRMALNIGAGFIVHARQEIARLNEIVGAKAIRFHVMPIFDQFPEASRVLPRRAQLELLFFGFIRPYKGLDVLIRAIAELDDIDVHLDIVGEPWELDADTWARTIQRVGQEKRIDLIPHYISSAEAANYFQRADAVVLPYKGATGTAVVATAFHYNRPVIASAVGGVKDVVEDGKSGILVRPNDSAALAEGIRHFAAGKFQLDEEALERAKEGMSWESLASVVLDLCANREGL